MAPNEKFPSVMAIWERFGHGLKSMKAYVFAEGDTTTSFCGGGQDARIVNFTAGDFAEEVILKPCTDACQHHIDDAIPEGTTCLFVRPDGRVEILRSGKDGAAAEIGEINLALAAIERPKDGHQVFHKTFPELQKSAICCAACAVILAALPDPKDFVPDSGRPLLLRPDSRDDAKSNRAVRHIEVGFPELDSFHPGVKVTRFGIVDVVCEHGFALDKKECSESHKACHFASPKRALPTRVIRLPTEEGLDPWLEDGNGMAEDYVALTYRWGSANMSKTLTSKSSRAQDSNSLCTSVEHHPRHHNHDPMSRIQVSLGGQLVHHPRFQGGLEARSLTHGGCVRKRRPNYSASASECADSGLFFKQNPVFLVPLTARSIGGKPFAKFSLAVRNCSSFSSDVQHGTLSDRGWCLQERILSRRILHFGASQTHWECLSAAWSANYSHQDKRDPRPIRMRKIFQTELQPSIPRPGPKTILDLADTTWKTWQGTDEQFSALESEPLPMLQLYGLQPHGTWYEVLLDYSRRQLTFPSDKLAALAGLALAFAKKTGDTYLNGLWLHGLPEGLLWSSLGLGHRTYESKSRSIRLDRPRAPSWSWASLDGPVVYPSSKYSYVDAAVHAYSMPGKSGNGVSCCGASAGDAEIIGINPSQRLILKARIKSLDKLDGFKPEHRRHLRENEDSRSACFVPHAIFDDADHDFDDLAGIYALFIAQVGCGNKECDHKSDCAAGFAHCLLVERKEEEQGEGVVWVRVGVAQCFSADVGSAPKLFLTLV
ncbi:hypothetical protein MRS44_018119 [Fusarium solani]|uniref:uncharacterized protein n=1 Tax=Fusarium solani TaxID=169388 RepID=UPI0032C48EB2|nr:hypothetical protein MRS44_018119 [Fusarium solani]